MRGGGALSRKRGAAMLDFCAAGAIRLGMAKLLLLAAAAPMLLAASDPGRLEVTLDNLRNARGVVRLCLAPSAAAFPSCAAGTGARQVNVAASAAARIVVDGVAPGEWAIAVLHDENGNEKLDTRLAIPREGFGFSNNPPVGFGAPAFARTRFTVTGPVTRHRVRMRYLL